MDRRLYNEIIKEHFDVCDDETRRCLLTINEADQNQVLGNLAAKLYDQIINKTTDIDFGQIPLSRGDITKIPNYMDMVECNTIVHDMMVDRKQTTNSVDIIFGAIENLKKTKHIWEKGYGIECEMVVVFYNTIALSIVSATSILLSATIEFIKNPESGVIDIELGKIAKAKSKDGLLFKNLEKFNAACKKGDIEKTFEAVLKAQRAVREEAIVQESIWQVLLMGSTIIGLLSCVIPILHQLTAALYNLRQSVAEYLSAEADIIRLNAEKVNYNRSKSEKERKKIIERQNKIADRFKAWSNKLMIKASKAESEAQKQIQKETSKKNKIGDVVDDMPDSASIF